jgi:hypothetical protein
MAGNNKTMDHLFNADFRQNNPMAQIEAQLATVGMAITVYKMDLRDSHDCKQTKGYCEGCTAIADM